MPTSQKRQSRTRTRAAKREIDPLPPDDPACRPTRIDYHRFLATHLGVVEKLLFTLQAYLRDLVVSETLLVQLGTAQNTEASAEYTWQLAANAQARAVQLTTLRTQLAFLANQGVDSEEEPPVSIH